MGTSNKSILRNSHSVELPLFLCGLGRAELRNESCPLTILLALAQDIPKESWGSPNAQVCGQEERLQSETAETTIVMCLPAPERDLAPHLARHRSPKRCLRNSGSDMANSAHSLCFGPGSMRPTPRVPPTLRPNGELASSPCACSRLMRGGRSGHWTAKAQAPNMAHTWARRRCILTAGAREHMTSEAQQIHLGLGPASRGGGGFGQYHAPGG